MTKDKKNERCEYLKFMPKVLTRYKDGTAKDVGGEYICKAVDKKIVDMSDDSYELLEQFKCYLENKKI